MTRDADRLGRLLRRLQLRLTLSFALIAAIGLTTLMVALLQVQERVEMARLDEDLRRQASTAASFVYLDDRERPQVDSIVSGLIDNGPGALVFFASDQAGGLDVIRASRQVNPDAVTPLAHDTMLDLSLSTQARVVVVDGTTWRAVAVPWFSGLRPRGAVVSLATPMGPSRASILQPAVIGGAALLLLLTLSAWEVAGRSLRPAAEALTGRERFLSTAAHELRAPLARLRAGAEAVRRSVPLTAEGGTALHRLVGVADSAAQVVSNLLLATRIEQAEIPVIFESVRLDRLAADLEHVFPGLVVVIDAEVTVWGDPALLRHAAMNLVDNAFRHGRVGEDVPLVMLTVERRDDGRPLLQVSDDGPGFPPDTDVLARFVAGPGGGTGLGLPLVTWIADKHGADVLMDTGGRQASGATVEIVFPVGHGRPSRRSVPRTSSGSRWRRLRRARP